MRPVSTTGTEKLRINVYCTIGWTYVLETQGQNVFQMWNGFHRLIYLNTWSPKGHSPWKCEIFRGRDWVGLRNLSLFPLSVFFLLHDYWWNVTDFLQRMLHTHLSCYDLMNPVELETQLGSSSLTLLLLGCFSYSHEFN